MIKPACPLCYRDDGAHAPGCRVGAYVEAWGEPEQASLFDDPAPDATETVFDREASEAARRSGMRKVAGGSDPEWCAKFDAAIKRVAGESYLLTGNDAWKYCPKPKEPRAAGPRMRVAVRAGIIEPTGAMRRSEIPTQHSAPIREYRSLIYTGPIPAAD